MIFQFFFFFFYLLIELYSFCTVARRVLLKALHLVFFSRPFDIFIPYTVYVIHQFYYCYILLLLLHFFIIVIIYLHEINHLFCCNRNQSDVKTVGPSNKTRLLLDIVLRQVTKIFIVPFAKRLVSDFDVLHNTRYCISYGNNIYIYNIFYYLLHTTITSCYWLYSGTSVDSHLSKANLVH